MNQTIIVLKERSVNVNKTRRNRDAFVSLFLNRFAGKTNTLVGCLWSIFFPIVSSKFLQTIELLSRRVGQIRTATVKKLHIGRSDNVKTQEQNRTEQTRNAFAVVDD